MQKTGRPILIDKPRQLDATFLKVSEKGNDEKK